MDTDCKGNRICIDGRCIAQQQGENDYGQGQYAPAQEEGRGEGAPVAKGEWHYKHKGMHTLGIVFFFTGIGLDVIGAGIFAAGSSQESYDCYGSSSSDCYYENTGGGLEAGGALMITAGTLLWVTGLVLWIVGSRKDYGPKDARAMPVLPTPYASAGTTWAPPPSAHLHGSGGLTVFRF